MSSRRAPPQQPEPQQVIDEATKKKIYFMRVGFGMIAGVISGVIPVIYSQAVGFIIGLLFYALSQFTAKYLLSEEIEPRVVSNVGFFSYIIIWLIFWTLVTTLLQWGSIPG